MQEVSFNFRGKTAIVTGGSRGIGRQIVEDLVLSGCNVTFTYAKEKEKADEIVKVLKEQTDLSVSCIKVDFMDQGETNAFIEYLKKEKRVDFLVNNVGFVRDKPLYTMEFDDWDDVMNVNLNSVFKISKGLIRKLATSKGSIVNISSIAGIMGNGGQTNYSASKAGLIGFTKALSKELGPLGVRVNCVAPGYIDTDLANETIEAAKASMEKSISLKRVGHCSEVSSCVMFLLSSASSYMTGKTLIPDGGIL